jgi:hypothetical protein
MVRSTHGRNAEGSGLLPPISFFNLAIAKEYLPCIATGYLPSRDLKKPSAIYFPRIRLLNLNEALQIYMFVSSNTRRHAS